eukprot:jgi/Chlat1/7750/Chrsp66S07234
MNWLASFAGNKGGESGKDDGQARWQQQQRRTQTAPLAHMSQAVTSAGTRLYAHLARGGQGARPGSASQAPTRGVDTVAHSFVPIQAHLSNNAKTKRKGFRALIVREGDTLASIAAHHKVSVRELKRINGLDNTMIFAGDQLVVLSRQGEGGEACAERERDRAERGLAMRRTHRPLFRRVGAVGGPDIASPLTTPSVSTTATAREREAARANSHRSRVPAGIHPAKIGADAKGRIVARGHKGWRAKWPRKFQFDSPITRAPISSTFGWRWGRMHEGIDFAAATGTAIRAAANGAVAYVGYDGGYGNFLDIDHEGGFTTRYAHCNVMRKRVGDRVTKGEWVADVGTTGHATGPHLHFEVRKDMKAIDPATVVRL